MIVEKFFQSVIGFCEKLFELFHHQCTSPLKLVSKHKFIFAIRGEGGGHNFQYFEHKHLDKWENVKKIFLVFKNSQKIQFPFSRN